MGEETVAPPVLRGWRLLGATLLVLAAVGLGRAAGAAGIGALLPRGIPPERDGLALSAGILVASALGGLLLGLLLHRRDPLRSLGITRPTAGQVGLGLAGSALLVVGFGLARRAAGEAPVPETWRLLAASAPLPLLVLAFAAAAPCFEEVFFRGFLQGSLRETRLGVWGAVLLPSALFALAHGPDGVLSLLEPLASALFVAFLREKTGSILPGVAAHALGNLLAITAARLAA
jgi:membrane protease YdiL (CAAX protease family)